MPYDARYAVMSVRKNILRESGWYHGLYVSSLLGRGFFYAKACKRSCQWQVLCMVKNAGGMDMIKAFTMKLYEGQEQEYERRHNLLWPEMKDMIHEYGGKNYSIFLDKETLTLFGYIEIEDEKKWSKSADTKINRKWWDFMADIMETNPDNSPVCMDLHPVFHLD